MKFKSLFHLSLAIVTLLLSSTPGTAKPIRIAIPGYNITQIAFFIARERGFFKEEGLEAEVIRMNANVAITALASGDTDYTMIFGSVVRAAIRGLPVRVVASLIDGSNPSQPGKLAQTMLPI